MAPLKALNRSVQIRIWLEKWLRFWCESWQIRVKVKVCPNNWLQVAAFCGDRRVLWYQIREDKSDIGASRKAMQRKSMADTSAALRTVYISREAVSYFSTFPASSIPSKI
jgi:hypothetical protein